MNANDIIIFNFEEVRRRSIKVWKAILEQMLNWKPDEDALTCAEMIRHLLEGEFLYHQVLVGRGSKGLTNLSNPFEDKDFTSVDWDMLLRIAYHESGLAGQLLDYMRTMGIDRPMIWD